ncbi:MAG: hypothetical protein ACYSWP_01280 [Planctomycetota bacterium]|jgi:hypothetical protein
MWIDTFFGGHENDTWAMKYSRKRGVVEVSYIDNDYSMILSNTTSRILTEYNEKKEI